MQSNMKGVLTLLAENKRRYIEDFAITLLIVIWLTSHSMALLSLGLT